MQAQTMDLSEAQASDYNRGNKGPGHKTSFLLSIVVAAAAKTHSVLLLFCRGRKYCYTFLAKEILLFTSQLSSHPLDLSGKGPRPLERLWRRPESSVCPVQGRGIFRAGRTVYKEASPLSLPSPYRPHLPPGSFWPFLPLSPGCSFPALSVSMWAPSAHGCTVTTALGDN